MVAQCQRLSFTVLLAIAFASLGSSSRAASAEPPAPTPPPDRQLQSVRFGLITGTTALIGSKIRDGHDSSVGRIEDVILDLSTGRAVAALFSCGSDNELAAVPARSFWTATSRKVMVSADHKTLKGAPRIPKAELTRALEPSSLGQSFAHFSQKLPELSAAKSGGLALASRTVHLPVVGQNKAPLGEIEDILVDLPVGRVVYLLVRPTVGGQAQGTLYAVPPQAVRPDAAGQALVLETDAAHFLAGPHFQREYRTDVSLPSFAAAVEQHYAREAVARDTASAAPPQAGPPRQDSTAAAQKLPARSDQEITKAVMMEIVRNESFTSLRGLKITASNGQVTVAGHLKSEKRKQQLLAAAARVVGAENVIYQPEMPSKQ